MHERFSYDWFFVKLTNYVTYVLQKSGESFMYRDLLLTNKPLSFSTTTAMGTGLSDFHKMIVAVIKIIFHKMKPREL